MTTMKDGTCPKCNCDTVYTSNLVDDFMGGGNPLVGAMMKGIGSRMINMTFYCCDACGYMESYISDQKSLKTVRKQWRVVRKAAQTD